MNAYNEGYTARQYLVPFSMNPYQRGTSKFELWREGWVDCDNRRSHVLKSCLAASRHTGVNQ